MILTQERIDHCRTHLGNLTKGLRDGGACARMVEDLIDSAEYLAEHHSPRTVDTINDPAVVTRAGIAVDFAKELIRKKQGPLDKLEVKFAVEMTDALLAALTLSPTESTPIPALPVATLCVLKG